MILHHWKKIAWKKINMNLFETASNKEEVDRLLPSIQENIKLNTNHLSLTIHNHTGSTVIPLDLSNTTTNTNNNPVLHMSEISLLQNSLNTPLSNHLKDYDDYPKLITLPIEYKEIFPYKKSFIHELLYYFCVLSTGGIILIMTSWYPQIYTIIGRKKIKSLLYADYILIKEIIKNNNENKKFVRLEEVQIIHNNEMYYFEYKKNRYIYNNEIKKFECVSATLNQSLQVIKNRMKMGGWRYPIVQQLSSSLGPNSITIEKPSFIRLLFAKLFHPFYLFQLFSSIVWFFQSYILYAITIIIISSVSIFFEIYTQIRNIKKLQNLVKMDAMIKVLRDGGVIKSVTISELVIGDIVIIEKGIVPADILLLSQECTVDESSLTGEAIPVTKRKINDTANKDIIINELSKTQFISSFLYCGSEIIKITMNDNNNNNKCMGVVLSTGFSTNKGQLFRSILFPQPIKFQFEQDSYRFLLSLSIVAMMAFIKRIYDGMMEGAIFKEIIISSLDLITIAVPPALPVVLTVGIGFAMERLENKKTKKLKDNNNHLIDKEEKNDSKILCIDPQRINVAGRIDCFCFDKTGTLTSDHLDFEGVDENLSGQTNHLNKNYYNNPLTNVALATCHSITLEEKNNNNTIAGYPLEKEMFLSTNSILKNTCNERNNQYSYIIQMNNNEQYGILKRYPFDASIQRSSVIIEKINNNNHTMDTTTTTNLFIFTKGSPEAIYNICDKNNNNLHSHEYFNKILSYYCSQGYYVLAIAYKNIQNHDHINNYNNNDDQDFKFLGFLLFINNIKKESYQIIQNLQESKINIRIITGDNALTAIHVTRKLGIQLSKRIILIDSYKKINNKDMIHNNNNIILNNHSLFFKEINDSSLDINTSNNNTNNDIMNLFSKSIFMELKKTCDFAITGSAIDILSSSNKSINKKEEHLNLDNINLLDDILLNAIIFARIPPEKKTYIINTLITKHNFYVGMCGDGTNDCGALKAAHVGLALSDADASIVAPFTSKKKRVSDVLLLIKEGRCSLTTSFLGFKYMCLYPIIQLTSVIILNHYGATMSNNQYMFDDLIVVLGLSMLMLRTKPSKTLTKDRPTDTLFDISVIMSLIGQLGIFFFFFIFSFYLLTNETWYCPLSKAKECNNNNNNINCNNNCFYLTSDTSFTPGSLLLKCYENTFVWMFAHFQYVIAAFALNIKGPFREHFYKNKGFLVYLIGVTFLLLFLLFLPHNNQEKNIGIKYIIKTFDLMEYGFPLNFRIKLFFILLTDLILSILWEYMVIHIITPKWKKQTTAYLLRKRRKSLPITKKDVNSNDQIP